MSTILVIDDDDAVRGWIAKVLERSGYTIRLASNGRAAMPELRGTTIDLVITDIFMPDQEGLETIAALRRQYTDLKIIAITGGDPQYLRIAKLMGASTGISKPFSDAQLLLKVKELIGESTDRSAKSADKRHRSTQA